MKICRQQYGLKGWVEMCHRLVKDWNADDADPSDDETLIFADFLHNPFFPAQ
jgi:hypothetical protein